MYSHPLIDSIILIIVIIICEQCCCLGKTKFLILFKVFVIDYTYDTQYNKDNSR